MMARITSAGSPVSKESWMLYIKDIMKDGHVALVMNSTEGAQAVEDSRSMRNVALMDRIPYFTTLAASHAAALAKRRSKFAVVAAAMSSSSEVGRSRTRCNN